MIRWHGGNVSQQTYDREEPQAVTELGGKDTCIDWGILREACVKGEGEEREGIPEGEGCTRHREDQAFWEVVGSTRYLEERGEKQS